MNSASFSCHFFRFSSIFSGVLFSFGFCSFDSVCCKFESFVSNSFIFASCFSKSDFFFSKSLSNFFTFSSCLATSFLFAKSSESSIFPCSLGSSVFWSLFSPFVSDFCSGCFSSTFLGEIFQISNFFKETWKEVQAIKHRICLFSKFCS